ncbi:hypothetical protein, partial [Thiolapillus sp.]|uniref:hypothetical protein n=1 Tax=Thiolapillus sp. TaxID=2017437 RepID=UPI003AF8E628
MQHVFFTPGMQGLVPSLSRPHVIACQITEREQAMKETVAADLAPRLLVGGEHIRRSLREFSQ